MDATGAQIIVDCLERENVEYVFGYPGGMNLPVYDALSESRRIRHVLARHEQGAAHAADGYARVSGKVGVCIATSGPGAMNLSTGIATAFMDSIPIVAFTGQVSLSSVGTDSFQEVDITGVTLPITKHNYLVKRTTDLPRVIKEAFHIARTGRPGPVLIDLPIDVTTGRCPYSYPNAVSLPGYKPTYDGHPLQVSRAAKAIASAKQPIIYAGGGVITSGACEELLQLAEITDTPVTTTLMGLGAFPGDHRLFLGMLGMHGTAYANYAVTECDLLVAIGARFDNRVTGMVTKFAPRAKVIHIDIDPAEIGKNVEVDIPIVGDAKRVLSALIPKLARRNLPEWHARIDEWKRSFPMRYAAKGLLKPQYVIEALYQVTRGDAIIVTDVGQHQMWTAQFYKFKKPRTLVTSGGLGTMGFGLPAAIGAQLGRPGAPVYAVIGDGGFQMNMQELATAMEHGLALKIIILNNKRLGMVRQLQEVYYGGRYTAVELDRSPDYIKLAEAFGAVGMRVSDAGEVLPALRQAAESDVLAIIEFLVDPAENVYPMVLGNKGINEMLMGVD